jgi:hypothetical protein
VAVEGVNDQHGGESELTVWSREGSPRSAKDGRAGSTNLKTPHATSAATGIVCGDGEGRGESCQQYNLRSSLAKDADKPDKTKGIVKWRSDSA